MKLQPPALPLRTLKYRLVIFDSDGTLADTLPWLRRVFNELADKHGFKRVEADEMERLRELHGRELLQALALPLWKVPQVARSMRVRMARDIGQFSLFAGVGEMLRRLAADRVTMGIVSSNSRENVERILGPARAGWIAHFACGASLFGKAPKLRQLLRASGIPPAEAIYLGDEVRDAEASRKAGMAFGAVAWGHHDERILRAQKPEAFFNTAEEIVAALR